MSEDSEGAVGEKTVKNEIPVCSGSGRYWQAAAATMQEEAALPLTSCPVKVYSCATIFQLFLMFMYFCEKY